MYEAFYQFKEKPFSLLPDPDFLFLSSKHAIALSMLEYSLAGQAGFCAITGEIGSGKTTLIRALLRRIGRDVTLGLISNTHSSHTELAAWSLAAFGQSVPATSDSDVYQSLMHFLINEYSAGRRCVLIVDEAQNLTIEALEELRLLSNINSERDLLLQIILVGQPQLLEKLKRPEMCQFAQRISVAYHLTALTFQETHKYITHRLAVAGVSRRVFSDLAVGIVQYYSGGVPRLINSICDMALVYGYAESLKTIELETVRKVIADRLSSGVAGFTSAANPNDPMVTAAIHALVAEAALIPAASREAPRKAAAPVHREPVLTSPAMARPAAPPKADAPRADAPRAGAPRADAPRADAPRADAPRAGAPRAGASRADAPLADTAPPAAPARARIVTPERAAPRLDRLSSEDHELRLNGTSHARAAAPHRASSAGEVRISWLRRAFGRTA